MPRPFLSLLSILLLAPCTLHAQPLHDLEAYDAHWESPSVHAGDSMPLVGGDLGCNVWVEDGELRLYANAVAV